MEADAVTGARLWTVARFPNGSWSTGGKPTDPEYALCEVFQVRASSREQAKRLAQSLRSRRRKKRPLWDAEHAPAPPPAKPGPRPPNDRGQGRKPLPEELRTKAKTVRLTPAGWQQFSALGGNQWLARAVKAAFARQNRTIASTAAAARASDSSLSPGASRKNNKKP